MIYELLDNLSYWSQMLICRISRRPSNNVLVQPSSSASLVPNPQVTVRPYM